MSSIIFLSSLIFFREDTWLEPRDSFSYRMGFRRIGVPFLRNWQGVFCRVSFPYLCFGLELNLLAQLSFVPSNDYASAHADHFRFSFAPEEGRFGEGLISLSWATSLPYNAGAWLLVGLPSPFVPLLYHNLGDLSRGFSKFFLCYSHPIGQPYARSFTSSWHHYNTTPRSRIQDGIIHKIGKNNLCIFIAFFSWQIAGTVV